MTVEEAQRMYAELSRALVRGIDDHDSRDYLLPPIEECGNCGWVSLMLDAASIALDIANAVASDERIRRSVAW